MGLQVAPISKFHPAVVSLRSPALTYDFNNNLAVAVAKDNPDERQARIEGFWDLMFRVALQCPKEGACDGRMTAKNLSAGLKKAFGREVLFYSDLKTFNNNFDGDVFGALDTIDNVNYIYLPDYQNDVPLVAASNSNQEDLSVLNMTIVLDGGQQISDTIDIDKFARLVVNRIKAHIGKEPNYAEFIAYARERQRLSHDKAAGK